jgi:signal transduction histidine kinase
MATLARSSARDPTPGRPVAAALIAEWRELGGLGRFATVGLVLWGVVAVGLGLWIEASVRRHLLEVRTEVIRDIVDDLVAEGVLPMGTAATPAADAVAAAIEHRIIGGEITGVVVRDPAGQAVYSNPERDASAPDRPADRIPHVEQHPDGLLHYHLPVVSSRGPAAGTFEVFQKSTSFDELMTRVRRNMWLAVAAAVGTLVTAMTALALAHARTLDQRRRHAEKLLRDLLHAEDHERRRIVASLHDDIGQPLYRVLYGLEGCRVGLEHDAERTSELDQLTALVRDVDRTLRTELHHLHRLTLEPLDLGTAVGAIAQDCRNETDLDVEVVVDTAREPSPVGRSVLLRAVEEALTNVRRHASAENVKIRISEDGGDILAEVVDDGAGCNGPRGLGLTTARERLEALGGRLSVQSGQDGGTAFRAWIPGLEVPS